MKGDDANELRKHFAGRFSTISHDLFHAKDQQQVSKQVLDLDSMVTISTTTAHMAAWFGKPIVLLAAKRQSAQWFWRAEVEYEKRFYPSVDVIQGDDGKAWWRSVLLPARERFAKRMQMRVNRYSND